MGHQGNTKVVKGSHMSQKMLKLSLVLSLAHQKLCTRGNKQKMGYYDVLLIEYLPQVKVHFPDIISMSKLIEDYCCGSHTIGAVTQKLTIKKSFNPS
jgi:hypothetical protein